MKLFAVSLLLMMGVLTAAQPVMANDRVLLELFTSQGCSSCPPADALMKRLSDNDPYVLVLSFHVHYWDYLGWKDPFSSPANTDRQKNYAALLHLKNVFTPQLIVNGTTSVIGSDPSLVAEAMHTARDDNPASFDIVFSPKSDHHLLMVTLKPKDPSADHAPADLFEVRYKKLAETSVGAGENGGRNLVTINNVLDMKKIGSWTKETPDYQLPLDITGDQGIAIIVQAPEQGKILAAGSYELDPSSPPSQQSP